jgi:hypothetical protein
MLNLPEYAAKGERKFKMSAGTKGIMPGTFVIKLNVKLVSFVMPAIKRADSKAELRLSQGLLAVPEHILVPTGEHTFAGIGLVLTGPT